jgi:hypothetical protein
MRSLQCKINIYTDCVREHMISGYQSNFNDPRDLIPRTMRHCWASECDSIKNKLEKLPLGTEEHKAFIEGSQRTLSLATQVAIFF